MKDNSNNSPEMDVQQAQQAREKEEALINDTFDAEDQTRDDDETARVVDHIAERQLCRKFDVRLMPVLAIMCEFFDRLFTYERRSELTGLKTSSTPLTRATWATLRQPVSVTTSTSRTTVSSQYSSVLTR